MTLFGVLLPELEPRMLFFRSTIPRFGELDPDEDPDPEPKRLNGFNDISLIFRAAEAMGLGLPLADCNSAYVRHGTPNQLHTGKSNFGVGVLTRLPTLGLEQFEARSLADLNFPCSLSNASNVCLLLLPFAWPENLRWSIKCSCAKQP